MTGPLSLPADGTLQILVICACLSLLMLGLTAVVQVRERQWPEARWAAIPLLLAVAAGLSARLGPGLHLACSVALVAITLRNAWEFRGVARRASALAAATWMVAMVAARLLMA